MTVLSSKDSIRIREKYITTFVDTSKEYFLKYIKNICHFKDGARYTGYLWDCFKFVELKNKEFCQSFLRKKEFFYVFWDLHLVENITIDNYWKYPIDSVLCTNITELEKQRNELPEDLYLFDDSFTWTIAYTHEDDLEGNQMIYYQERL